jgi:hypothetical protein
MDDPGPTANHSSNQIENQGHQEIEYQNTSETEDTLNSTITKLHLNESATFCIKTSDYNDLLAELAETKKNLDRLQVLHKVTLESLASRDSDSGESTRKKRKIVRKKNNSINFNKVTR